MFTASTLSAMSFATGGLKAFGEYQTGKQMQSAYNYNADIFEQKAEATRQSAALQEIQQRKQLAKDIGYQQTAYAGSGVAVGTGSPLDTMVDSLSNGYMNIAINKYNNEVAARGNESAAAMSRYEGSQARREETSKAALTLLQGATTYGEKMLEKKKVTT